MPRSFTSLLLFFPLDDVAACENARVVRQLEGGLNLDMARGSQDVGTQ
jgi:hypothetical protein